MELLAGIGLFFVKTQVRSARILIVMHLAFFYYWALLDFRDTKYCGHGTQQ